jgi:hypothetical protein
MPRSTIDDAHLTVPAAPRRRRLTRLLVAVAVVVGVGSGAVVATAAIPDQSGKIHGCYSTKTGALRVIDSAKHCAAGTRALNWNQRGPRGYRGYRGYRGPQGAQGPQGPQGDAGPAGSALGWVVVSSDGTIWSHGGQLAAPTITHPATGIYCVTGSNWVQQGGPYSANIVNSGNPGQIAINPYFWGSTCNPTGYFIAVHTFSGSGTAQDSYFMLSKLG